MNKYQKGKARAREMAVDFIISQGGQSYSWEEIAEIQSNFERLGRRYGLLREFRENAIC